MPRRALPLLCAIVLLSLAGLAAAAGPPPYESPMREQCTTELRKDLRWRAEVAAELTGDKAFEFHAEQARIFATGKRHVIYAYAAIMVLTAGFALVLYRRQRQLVEEIAGLRTQIERAAKE